MRVALRCLLLAVAICFGSRVRPVIAMPDGPPGANTGDSAYPVEGLAFSADAQELTGAARTRIPITVPPGRNGVQPDLTLTYSSQKAPGLYGAGWDIPIPRIERSTRMGVPSYTDQDTFVLILPEGASELVPLGDGTYAARVDELHASVRPDKTSNTWTLHDRSGRFYAFAEPVGPNSTSFDTSFSWSVSSIEVSANTIGDVIQFTYSHFPGTNYAYPSHIAYGVLNVLPLPFAVDFSWRPRSASAFRVSYAAGFPQIASYDLSQIVTSFNSNIVRTYQIMWNPSVANGGPLLSEVHLLGNDGTLLQTTSKTPASDRFAYYPQLPPDSASDPPYATARSEDIHMATFRDPDACHNRDFIDLNGDGRPDLINTAGWSPGSPFWQVYLNQGPNAPTLFATTATPWYAPSNCIVKTQTTSVTSADGYNTTTILTVNATVDMNGDGLPDYVVYVPGQATASVYLNTGAGFNSSSTPPWNMQGAPALRQSATEAYPSGQVYNSYTQVELIDLNGDGRPDIVSTLPWTPTNKIWHVRWNVGTGFLASQSVPAFGSFIRAGSGNDPTRDTHVDLFDINGDGLPDEVAAAGDSAHWNVWYGTGTGFAAAYGDGTPFLWNSPPLPHLRGWNAGKTIVQYDVVDINGDHLPDLIDATNWSTTNPVWVVYLNTGQGFTNGTPQGAPSLLRRTATNSRALIVDTFDVDGNGYPDSVKLPGTSSTTATITLAHPLAYRPDFLSTMTNPLGGQTALMYNISTAFNTPNIDPDLRDGVYHLPFPIFPVASVEQIDPTGGIGGKILTTYAYDGGYYDSARREFRGFATVTKSDTYGKTDAIEYHQTDALRGKPISSVTYATLTGGVVRDTLWNWAVGTIGARYLPTLAASDQQTCSSPTGDTNWTTGACRTAHHQYGPDPCGGVVFDVTTDPEDSATTVAKGVNFDQQPYYDTANCRAYGVCATGFCDRPASTELSDGGAMDHCVGGTAAGTACSDNTPCTGGGFCAMSVRKSMAYDAAGHVTSITQLGLDNPVTAFTYDNYGNVSLATDPRRIATRILYDTATQSYPEQTIRDFWGFRHTTTRHYRPEWGQVADVTDEAGAQTSYQYDPFGRLAAVIEPGQAPSLPTRKFAFIIGASSPFRRDTLTYEPNRPSNPYLTQSEFFDALGRPLQRQRLTEVAGNDAVVVTGARHYVSGGQVDLEYAPLVTTGDPSVRFLAPAASPATSFAYDAFSRVIRTTNPDNTATTVSRATARVEKRCDARHTANTSAGMCAEDQLDAAGRVTFHRTYLGANSSPDTILQRFYDGVGRVVRVRQGNLAATDVVTTYDALGRKSSVADPDSGLWRFGYDDNGNLVYKDDPMPSRHLEFLYDNLNRLSVTDLYTGTDAYHSGGTRHRIELYDYDGAGSYGMGRLAQVTDYLDDGVTMSSRTKFASYDPRGNVYQKEEPRSTPENRPMVDGSNPANGGGSDVVIALTALPPPPARCGGACASCVART